MNAKLVEEAHDDLAHIEYVLDELFGPIYPLRVKTLEAAQRPGLPGAAILTIGAGKCLRGRSQFLQFPNFLSVKIRNSSSARELSIAQIYVRT